MKPYSKIHRLRGLQLRARQQLGQRGPSHYALACGDDFVLHVGDKLSDLIFTGRDYEPVESAYCRRYLQPGDVAFDVGANIGYLTALFSRCVGAQGLVVALEPGSHTYRLLSQTIHELELGNVTALPVALWYRSEILSFHSSRAGEDAQQSVARRDKHGSDVVLMPVPAISFAELVASQWFRQCPEPALIKIDVEGAESQVIEGMSAFLDGIGSPTPALLIECNTEALRSLGNDPVALLQRLEGWYELFATPLCWPPWHTTNAAFTPLQSPASLPDNAEMNVLAVPRNGPYRARALNALG